MSLPSLSLPLSLSTTTRTFLIITFDCCVGIIKERLGVRGIVDSVSRCPLPSPSPSPSAPSYSLLLIVSLVSSKSAREAEASLTACSDARSLLLGGVPHRDESLARNPSQVVSCLQVVSCKESLNARSLLSRGVSCCEESLVARSLLLQ